GPAGTAAGPDGRPGRVDGGGDHRRGGEGGGGQDGAGGARRPPASPPVPGWAAVRELARHPGASLGASGGAGPVLACAGGAGPVPPGGRGLPGRVVPVVAGRPAGAGGTGQRGRRDAGPSAAARGCRERGAGHQPGPAGGADLGGGDRSGGPAGGGGGGGGRAEWPAPPRGPPGPRRGARRRPPRGAGPRRAGRHGVAAEPAAAAQIAASCGYLPLALRIVGARLAAKPHWRIQRLADRLAAHHRRLDELTVGDLEVRASFALSYRGVTELER